MYALVDAQQTSPCINTKPIIREFTASSTRQSFAAINGPFPPSSRRTFLRFVSADAFRHLLPTSVEPVNETMFTSSFLKIASPVILPEPDTMFNTPGGNPASRNISPIIEHAIGARDEALSTTVLPAESAGHMVLVAI